MGVATTKIGTVTEYIESYGRGGDGNSPTADQWARILERPVTDPLTLINFFKFRTRADYGDAVDTDTSVTGAEAFNRYANVSIPTMERVGGQFLHVGPFAGSFIGADEDWDLVAIGAYPNLEALNALYSDAGYRAAFIHRSAACERQKVLICA
tara:strand:- start:128 stop:586 length:459 start_codon:yes stop_codon:yes gene_type:complete